MWSHAHPLLKCPSCRGPLGLHAVTLEAGGASVPRHGGGSAGTGDAEWIEEGALECTACRTAYPILAGVPILLSYETRMATEAAAGWPGTLRTDLESRGVGLAHGSPPQGEQFVSASFSTEWAAYDYGDTLWTAPVEDRIQTFRGECGLDPGDLQGQRFVEIGCGLGITTNQAATTLGAEAWGVDLSVAVFRAARHFRSNPNLHFVQASVFHLPFEPAQFDFLYSHGVLHHTWSTREAVACAASMVREGGGIYIWLYGHEDVNISLARRTAYSVEALARPVIARMPPWMATVALLPTIPAYQIASAMGRRSGTHMQTYSAKEALHAARDRFTPLYAHRHDVPEVQGWLEDLGFGSIQRVTGDEVSEGWALAIDRNVALRARLVTSTREVGAT